MYLYMYIILYIYINISYKYTYDYDYMRSFICTAYKYSRIYVLTCVYGIMLHMCSYG